MSASESTINEEKKTITKSWTQRVAEKLVGRKIVKVRYMDEQEAEDCGFESRPIVFILDDGNSIYPMHDDEGNDAGAMGTTFQKLPTIPVIY